jgi:hypothetical protein
MTSTPFSPVAPGDDWCRNAVQPMREDDAWLGFGFISAADALIEHWVEHGPNDGHLMPIILTYRHGLELLLKAAIRDASACLRREGNQDRTVSRQAIDDWLARDAGHSLQQLANRLDAYLDRLDEDRLPMDTHDVLTSLHTLDPRGDTFRYATTWDKAAQRYVPSPRPLASHIDVVAMGKQFGAAASLIGGGVLTVLDLIREHQDEMLRDADP